MDRYKTNKIPPRFLTKKEIFTILKASRMLGIGNFAATAIYSGMRFFFAALVVQVGLLTIPVERCCRGLFRGIIL